MVEPDLAARRTRPQRVLFLVRHFPPAVTGGARRPYLLMRGLEALGVETRVVAPVLPAAVKGMEAAHPSPEPRVDGPPKSPGVKDWARLNLLLPDPDIRWARRAAHGVMALADFRPDWIVSSSPPESVHAVAPGLAKKLGCRWAADLRDGWLEDPLLPIRRRPWRRAMEREIARRTLGKADLVLAPSQAILDEAESYAPDSARLLLPQPGPSIAEAGVARRDDGDIEILHAGSFSLSHGERKIEPALALFAAIRKQDARFRLVLVGRLTREEEAAARAIEGVELRGVLPVEKSWAAQARADILLLVAAPGTTAEPGKMSEYRMTGRPVVCLGGGMWRDRLPGAERDPETLLMALRTPDERKKLAQLQSGDALAPERAAGLLLDAMTSA